MPEGDQVRSSSDYSGGWRVREVGIDRPKEEGEGCRIQRGRVGGRLLCEDGVTKSLRRDRLSHPQTDLRRRRVGVPVRRKISVIPVSWIRH